jgi:DNA-directed RNA polymerase subunit N (RpoN/RPB10)
MEDIPTTDETLPEPADVFVDPTHPRPDEVVAALVDAGLLTERQAEAYVRRVIEMEPRETVADDMGISTSTLDDHRGAAKDAVAAARKTVAILDAYRSPALPERCSECGAALGGRWVGTDDGEVLCPDCAGVSTDV